MRRLLLSFCLAAMVVPAVADARYLHLRDAKRATLKWMRHGPDVQVLGCYHTTTTHAYCQVFIPHANPGGTDASWTGPVSVMAAGRDVIAWVSGYEGLAIIRAS